MKIRCGLFSITVTVLVLLIAGACTQAVIPPVEHPVVSDSVTDTIATTGPTGRANLFAKSGRSITILARDEFGEPLANVWVKYDELGDSTIALTLSDKTAAVPTTIYIESIDDVPRLSEKSLRSAVPITLRVLEMANDTREVLEIIYTSVSSSISIVSLVQDPPVYDPSCDVPFPFVYHCTFTPAHIDALLDLAGLLLILFPEAVTSAAGASLALSSTSLAITVLDWIGISMETELDLYSILGIPGTYVIIPHAYKLNESFCLLLDESLISDGASSDNDESNGSQGDIEDGHGDENESNSETDRTGLIDANLEPPPRPPEFPGTFVVDNYVETVGFCIMLTDVRHYRDDIMLNRIDFDYLSYNIFELRLWYWARDYTEVTKLECSESDKEISLTDDHDSRNDYWGPDERSRNWVVHVEALSEGIADIYVDLKLTDGTWLNSITKVSIELMAK